jgi:hypothetical protein
VDAAPRRDPRREACDELARRLLTPEGIATAPPLEDARSPASDERAPLPSAEEAAEALATRYLGETASPIGIWKPRAPQTDDGDVVFVRDDAETTRDWWPPHQRLTTKSSLLPLRVILLGESTAAGWFYAPALTPTAVLATNLDAARGPGIYEVLDLTMVNQQPSDLVELAGAVLQLAPDVVVVFAGNNWPVRLPSFPGATPADCVPAAQALRANGTVGLRGMADEATRGQVERTLEILGRVANAAHVSLVVVIPEVSLGWPRDRPVPWLPGDATARWHAAHAKALGALEIGAGAAAAEAARAMLALDGGVSPTSHRLLGDALVALGRTDEALAAHRHAVDARAWDNHPPIPSTTSVVRETILAGAEEWDYVCVDLPALRAADPGPASDRSLFLDYCHLAADGMRVAMAAVASEIRHLVESTPARTSRRAVPSAPVVPPQTDAAVKFMSGLYTAHWGEPPDLGILPRGRRAREWLRAALQVSPGIEAALRVYAAERAVPAGAPLSAERQRLASALPELERLSTLDDSLDPEMVDAIREALAAGGRPLASDVEERLVRHHSVAHGAVDLLHPRYYWRSLDRYDSGAFGQTVCGFYRARWPVSHFCLVADGIHGARLQLTARLPRVASARSGEVGVEVNGHALDVATLTHRWSRAAAPIGATHLRRGFNRVTLRWPALPAEGDAALAQILSRLEQGQPTDLHPVFGEVAVLRAT